MTVTFGRQVEAAELAAVDGVRVASVDRHVVRLTAPEGAMDALVKAVARHEVADLVSEPADLEEIFLELSREAGDDD